MKIYTVTTVLPSIGSSTTVHPTKQTALDTVRADVTAGPDITDDQLIEFAERDGAEVIIDEHDLTIELLAVRESDSYGVDLTLFVGGQHTSDWNSVVVDDGAGNTLREWRESRDVYSQNATEAFSAAIVEAFNAHEDSEYVTDEDEDEESEDAHVTPTDVPADVTAVIAAIRSMYPTATAFQVSSSDQGRYGYWLDAVKFDDSTVIDRDSGTFEDLAEDMQTKYLDNMRWGSFGDKNDDSVFDVDMSTSRIIR